MSSMSATELQKAIKNSIVMDIMSNGISNTHEEVIQIDSYKWLVPVEIEGEQYFSEIALTAKKADFTYEDAMNAKAKFIEKYEKACQREADRAAKKVAKGETKSDKPRNSSGNLESSAVVNGEYIPYAERYANDDF